MPNEKNQPHAMPGAIACLFVVLLLQASTSLFAQPLQVTLVDQLVLSDDEDAPLEYLFAGPRHITTDAQGNIYVADGFGVKIRVFDKTGTFLRTIGSRGQGPGEFQDVSAMAVDAHDNLVIVDRRNQRITKYMDQGQRFESYPFPEETLVDIYAILPLGPDLYGLNYKKRHHENTPDPRPELLHLFDADFNERKQSLVAASDLYDLSDPFHRALLRLSPGRFAVDREGSIWVAPRFYEGTLFRYAQEQGRWVRAMIKGHDPGYAPYELYDPESKGKGFRHSFLINSRTDGKFAATPRSTSKGVFILNDGRVVHFTKMGKNEKRRVYGVEIFDSAGHYLGYGPISNLKAPRGRTLRFSVFHVDEEDRFYIVENSNDFPVIRVVTLEYTRLP